MSRVSSKAVFAHSIRLLFAASALFILASGTLQPVTGNAQPKFGTRRTQSAWIKLCFDVPYAQSNAESGSAKPPAASETVKACFTYMTDKLSYLHSREICDTSGCFARAELSQSQLEEIKAAKVITMSFGNDFMGGTILTPRACCRFAEAFAGTPVHASAYDEMQRKVIEVLLRKFPDFIQ